MIDWLGIKALSFDCYGTLIDWERGLLNVLLPWAKRAGLEAAGGCGGRGETLADRLLAAFAEAESRREAEAFREYPDVLRLVMRDLGEALSVPVSIDEMNALADSVGAWPAFPDTVRALLALRRRFRLVIVSNIDHASLARTCRLLEGEFDAVITAQDVRSYKPAAPHFDAAERVIRSMGIEPSAWVHVAQSLFHDIAPASARGIQTVWVDRRAGRPGGATCRPLMAVRPDITVPDLHTLALVCGASGS